LLLVILGGVEASNEIIDVWTLQKLRVAWNDYYESKSSLSICRGLVPGPPTDRTFEDTQVP
jgi:hypothetical protein